MTSIEYLSLAETNKILRVTLRKRFPGVKFSVRGNKSSMCHSTYIDWTGGPSQNEVDEVVEPFRRSNFDCMTDSTNHVHTNVGPNGEQSGIDYVCLFREQG